MYRLLTALIVLIAGSACQKGNVPDPATEVTTTTNNTSFNVNQFTLLQLVNKVRSSGCNCGVTAMPPVSTVSWNQQLAQAAYNHSKDMATQNYFDHTAKNGTDPGMRITAAGYTWRTYGENIAMGYANEQSVMDGWLASEGHCRNIMNGNFKEMGVGREGSYWTQEFGAK